MAAETAGILHVLMVLMYTGESRRQCCTSTTCNRHTEGVRWWERQIEGVLLRGSSLTRWHQARPGRKGKSVNKVRNHSPTTQSIGPDAISNKQYPIQFPQSQSTVQSRNQRLTRRQRHRKILSNPESHGVSTQLNRGWQAERRVQSLKEVKHQKVINTVTQSHSQYQ